MQLRYLIALFIGLPIIELMLLFELHDAVGFFRTFLLVVLTGVAGAALVRRQGLATLFDIQRRISAGNIPTPQLLDGIMILIAGAFLLTPGLLTDTAGFLLLIPMIRKKIRVGLKKILEEKMGSNYVEIHVRRPGE